MLTLFLTKRQQHLDLLYEHDSEGTAASIPRSGASRSSTRPTRCSPSAATTRSRSRTSRAPPASRAGSCTTTSAAARRSTSRCSSGSAPCARNNCRRPWAAAPAPAWPMTCRAGSTGPSRTARSGSARSPTARTSPTPTSGRVVTDLVRRAVALVAARHADIAEDSPRLRYALECWTGLNRAATRRWLQRRGHPRGDPRVARLDARTRPTHLRHSTQAKPAHSSSLRSQPSSSMPGSGAAGA